MDVNISSINFRQKYNTGHILEVTTRKIFEPDGVNGYIETIKKLYGNIPRYTGHRGYKKYAEIVGNKILANYPHIASATNEIIEIAQHSRAIRAAEFKKEIQPILDKFEKEIDIVI